MKSTHILILFIGCILITVFIIVKIISPDEIIIADNQNLTKMTLNETQTTIEPRIRESAIAGSWYPADKEELKDLLNNYLDNSDTKDLGRIHALICPHAGYIYSGKIAALGYQQLKDRRYTKVIILAPSHHISLKGASIPNYTHYNTPLGSVKVSDISRKLAHETSLIQTVEKAHIKEHSLEIQLPLLQLTQDEFEIIPILVVSNMF